MGNFIGFFQMHPFLSMALLASFIIVMAYEGHRKVLSLNNVLPQQAILLMNKNARVFDLRSKEEFKKGHILGATNHQGILDASDPSLIKIKDKIILLVCSSGSQSGKEAVRLNKIGFKTIYSLGGGMAAWSAEKLPYETE
jgi:rhodanese-related sulfurtransferase